MAHGRSNAMSSIEIVHCENVKENRQNIRFTPRIDVIRIYDQELASLMQFNQKKLSAQPMQRAIPAATEKSQIRTMKKKNHDHRL